MPDFRIESAAGDVLNYGYASRAEAGRDLDALRLRDNRQYLHATVEETLMTALTPTAALRAVIVKAYQQWGGGDPCLAEAIVAAGWKSPAEVAALVRTATEKATQ